MAKQGKIIQDKFNGGMNHTDDPSKIAGDEYYLLINGRIRENTIKPIRKHLDITVGLPSGGNLQGIYGTDNLLLVFVDGNAYYRDLTPSVNMVQFAKVANFPTMDATVPQIFVELVPSSTINFGRKVADESEASSSLNLTTPITKSPACAVVQDGVNQPRFIFPDGSSRISQNYNEWTQIDREYVPIGKNMAYINGVLYIVSSDNKLFYRSITGRPVDFMIIVDENGDKLPEESQGGAQKVSHAVSYYSITDIQRLNSFNKGFLITTNRSSHIISPNFEFLIYGEPTFQNADLFGTGSQNAFSVTELSGDIALIDFNSIRSFNAMQSTSFEGKNTPFNRRVDNMFEFEANKPVIQSYTAAITYDNYGVFGVNTTFGYGILIYDTLKDPQDPREIWPSLDLLDPITEGAVKQFCEIKIAGVRKLFFITSLGKVFEAWGDDSTFARTEIYTKEFTSNDPEVENQPMSLRLVFLNVRENGVVSVTPYVDGFKEKTITEKLKGTPVIPQSVISPRPYGNKSQKDSTRNLTFTWMNLRQGWKTGFYIEWQCDAELSHIMVLTQQSQMETSIEQESLT